MYINTGDGDDVVIINNGDSDEANEPNNCCAPGVQGYTGSAGDIGPIGYTGSAGSEGPSGPPGIDGEAGATGYTGSSGNDGIIGYTGSQGPIGYTGSAGICIEPCFDAATTLVTDDYTIEDENCYVGVNADKAITVTLPRDAPDGKLYIIKLERGSPVGDRKVTIVPSDGELIDGKSKLVLENAYSSAHLIQRGGKWHIVSLYP
jgi:hypothetical protein